MLAELNEKFLLFDGAMGTMLQKRGLKAGANPESLNITDPETVLSIHREYVSAGAEIITANTFGANSLKIIGQYSVNEIIKAGISIAKQSGAKYTALDVGPLGALLEPIGTLTFNEAYELFKEQVIAGVQAGADLILIETIADLLEMKAAVLAARENSDLPVFATMTFSEDKRTFLGADPRTVAITLSAWGVDAIGVNCSLGPCELTPVVEEILEYSTVPVIVQPNAGLPKIINGNTCYEMSAEEFAESVSAMADMGVSVFGGCCGTTPEYISRLREILSEKEFKQREIKRHCAFSSGQESVVLDSSTAVIGERINPTGKKKLQAAIRANDFDYITEEAINQQQCGADILDVNAGLPDIDEAAMLPEMVRQIQAVTSLPLQIDSSNVSAIEAAVRVYNGKPIINSVNGKDESLNSILPIAKKYGAAVIGLTLDENGIPSTAEERFKIAEKILNKAIELGIPREDVLIDCLVLTASTNQEMVMQTLEAIKLVKSRLGLKTVLGVSNVSFGLPSREVINSTFLAAAFGAGLDMPILNPMSKPYMQVVDSFKVLNNEDVGADNYIRSYSSVQTEPLGEEKAEDIASIIISGKKGKIPQTVRQLLTEKSPMEIINQHFIPVLDEVGKKFRDEEIFLPQLMKSAETVKAGFDIIAECAEGADIPQKGKIVLATVKDDIHDIGKNIVKMLLKNYGYDVIDLGRDVPPECVVEAIKENNVKLVGLSALMTTTVASMEETIRQIRAENLECKVMVGGAVLNPEYAQMVGADFYSRDAAESADIAASVLG